MKVALVCDWLTNVGGAEKVLLKIHQLYPGAPIYTSQYDPKGIDWFKNADVKTSKFLQKFPSKLRRLLGPLRQWHFSHLDLSEYDLIISVTGAEAKSVKSGKWLRRRGKKSKNPNGIHISYCHVPTQYYWQMYKDYIKNPGFGILNPLVRLFFRLMIIPLRHADKKAAKRPDYYITISDYAKEQIKKYYHRESTVINPPVEIEDFSMSQKGNLNKQKHFSSDVEELPEVGMSSVKKEHFEVIRSLARRGRAPAARGDGPAGRAPKNVFFDAYFITTSRQVNWKRLDLAVKACMMTQRKLLVIGEGPEHKKLEKLAKNSGLVEFLPLIKKSELAKYLAAAKGYIFPSLEPFGIAPVEALAAGCPVIAYGEGGALDYIKPGKNGILFKEQTAKSLATAILEFDKIKFNRTTVSKSANHFSNSRFDREIKKFIKNHEKPHAKKS